jgi:hypothetical protein
MIEMETKRTLALAVVLATSLLAAPSFTPSAAASPRINVGIRVNAPPPPLRREVVVTRPGRSHVWVPGHWDWAPGRNEYVWVPGAWERPHHRHAVWVGPRWERRGHDTFYIRGHWR